MEPVHQPDSIDLKVALIIGCFLWGIVVLQIAFGHWDWLLAQAADYFPLWPWGG